MSINESGYLSRRQCLARSLGSIGGLAWGALALRRAESIARAADAAPELKQPSKADVAWLKQIQQPPTKVPALPAGTPKLAKLLVDQQGKQIKTLDAWNKHRREIRKWWLDFLQPMKVKNKPLKLTVIKEDRPRGVIRQLVRYQCEPGLEVEAYLLKPDPGKKGKGNERDQEKLPGVVVLHSTVNYTIRQPAGVEGKSEKAFGLRLAQQGMVAICPKNFLWVGPGDFNSRVARFNKRHPNSTGMAKMLFDSQRAIDVLLTVPEVDPARIGTVGHSLGAKEALYLAALDERIKVAVSSEGGIGTRFSNWDAPWYLGKKIREKEFVREHHELLALVAPRPFLLVGGDSADGDRSWPFIDAAMPVYQLTKSAPAPRLGLLNHGKGHAVPPIAVKRIDEWLATYL